MASQKQTEANRLNAKKSTGPRSAEGKAASRMNALKSGIDAKSMIIHGEKAAAMEALKAEYYDRFDPATPEQRMLVDVLIDSEWLLRRFRSVEAQLFEEGVRKLFQPDQDIVVGQAYDRNADVFARLQRRVDTALRNYRNALQDLKRLQAEEPSPGPDPAPLATSKNQSLPPANGFVPQASHPTPAPSDPPLPGSQRSIMSTESGPK